MLLIYLVAFIDEEKKNNHWNITTTLTQTICANRFALHAGKQGTRFAEAWALA